MMTGMRALVFDGPRTMSIAERPDPDAAPGEVVVGVVHAGICGSELGSFTGDSTRRPPGRVFGHELAGTIVAVGAGVAVDRVGEPVAVNPLTWCGDCPACRAGRPNICAARTLLGMQRDGGFAGRVAVPAAAARPLAGLDTVGGAFAEPVANAVHVAGLIDGARRGAALVIGAGAIGLCVTAVLRAGGAGHLVVTDPVAPRRALAIAAGADEAVEPAAITGPFDAVVDAAGTDAARALALRVGAPGATVVLLGLHSAVSPLAINEAILRELRLQTSYAFRPAEYDDALALLRTGAIPYREWTTERPLDDGEAAFATLADRPAEATKIVLRV
jgi:2-desacetyl-2-hydroxyethyl bacteriochlorophyllide A dehydrogenase